MKFEDALYKLREGKKIRHPNMPDDEYFMGCYVGLIGMEGDFEEIKKRGMSIVKMKGDCEHLDMRPQFSFIEQTHLLYKYPFLKEKITYPTINLLLIMSDDWEIME